MKTTEEKTKTYQAFVNRLQNLSNGELATLRRCNGNPLEDTRLLSTLGMMGALNRYEYALIACLYAVYHKSEDRIFILDNYNFGKAFRNAYDPENKKQDTRFRAILSADKGDSLAYRLRQAIKLMKSKGEAIDFATLLSHLMYWDREEKWVQRKWAQGYYEIFSDSIEEPDESEAEDLDYEENED